jgi:adenylyl cyclase-associated protein
MAEITSLSALLKRLETATTKLEDLALAGASATNVSALTGNTGAPPVQEATHPHIEGYDELVDGPVKTFYELSKLVGGDVEEQVLIIYDRGQGEEECNCPSVVTVRNSSC